MKKTSHKSEIAHALMHNICLVAVILAIFFGFTCISTASNEGDANLNGTNSSHSADDDADSLTNSDSAALSQLNEEKLISGIGYGELLLTFTVNKVLPVFSSRYSYDIVGINIPPISTPWQRTGDSNKTGYSLIFPNVYIPGKPNNFTVSARGVKTLNIGLKKDPEKWRLNYTRTWITTQVKADRNGTAITDSDLLSPGTYQTKIFGDAAENVSQIYLTMTVVKKLVVNGPYDLRINTTSFPEGDYSFKAKALNGTFKIDEILIEI